MRIRFGYVAIALNILEGSPNKTITYTNLLKILDHEDRISRLRKLSKENLDCQLRILKYNKAHGIYIFRITSKLIPLATHPISDGWNYIDEFSEEFKEIGLYIKENAMRISAHPDHFTLLNSPNEKVIEASIKDLVYHNNIFKAMGLNSEAKLVLHVGGAYKDKDKAIERFITNYEMVPQEIKQRLIIENDDKIFNAQDVLALCERIKLPMVLDLHHHFCCNNGVDIKELWPRIIETWQGAIPKIHISSPKDSKNIRSHADFINVDDFYMFLDMAKEYKEDFDVMVEAKKKDKAMFKLIEDLDYRYNLKARGEALIEI